MKKSLDAQVFRINMHDDSVSFVVSMLPVHAFRCLPLHHSCPGCSLLVSLQTASDLPPFVSLPVLDDSGVVYAKDIAATDGFYLTVVAFVLLRALTLEIRKRKLS